MYPVEQIVTNNLTGNRLSFIIQQHHVIAVPANRTADVQQQLRHIQHGGGNLVGNHFSRVEMPGVQAQRRLAAGGIPHVKLIGANRVALRANTKQFALNGVDMVRRIQLLADHLIQSCQQTLTRGETVNGDIFHAIRDPDVHHRWCAKLLAKIG